MPDHGSHPPAPARPEPSREDAFPGLAAAVTARLAKARRPGTLWLSGYARGKLHMDPVYRAVLPLVPAGARVLDLGCGLGLLGLLLEARGQGNAVHGIEWDAPKARFARRMAAGTIVQGDLLQEPWPACDVVVLLDVLHYFEPGIQRGLLGRIARHLPPGGRLLVRITDGHAPGRAATLTRLCERMAVKLGWNLAPRVHWRPAAEVMDDLRGEELRVRDEHASLGNHLLVADRP